MDWLTGVISGLLGIAGNAIPLWVLLAYLLYNAAVQALPSPEEWAKGSGGVVPGWYLFVYRFAHGVAMNLKLIPAKRYEEFFDKKTVPVVPRK